MKNNLLLILSSALLILNCSAQTWSPMGTNYAFNANSFVELNEELYVGFETFKDFHGVGKLDGNQWVNLGEGVPGINPFVKKLGVYDNELYISGEFTEVGGKKGIINLARWNGKEWRDVGGSFDHYLSMVHDFEVYKDELYIIGTFKNVGGKKIKSFAKWNGKTWLPVGVALDGTFNDLVVYKDELYVAGIFKPGDLKVIINVAKYDGVKWTTDGPLSNNKVQDKKVYVNSTPFDYFYHLIVYNDELYASGQFNDAKAKYSHCIQKWDGTSWVALPKQIEGTADINALAVYNGNLIAAGLFDKAGGKPVKNIAKWDGSEWLPCGAGTDNTIQQMIVFNNELIVTGLFEKAGGKEIKYMARYKEEITE